MEERVVPFVSGDYFSPIDEAQIVIVAEFFDVIEEAIKHGAEALGLVHSKIVDNKFCLKLGNGGYYLIDPNPEMSIVIRTDDYLNNIPGDFGVLESHIIKITTDLKERISKSSK